MLGMYKKAEEVSSKGPKSPLQIRILFHVTHKMNDEEKLMQLHQQLQDVLPDQLSLASMHYMRNHYQEAIDVYKRYLLQNRCVTQLYTRTMSRQLINIFLNRILTIFQ